VENDSGFARFLLDTAREKGCKGLVTSLGASALSLAREYKPEAVLLDIHLPDMQGWRVLDRLKADILTRHIPVCVISTDDSRNYALNSGALAFVTKPIQSRDAVDQLFVMLKGYAEQKKKKILVFEADQHLRNSITELANLENSTFVVAKDERTAKKALAKGQISCVIAGPNHADAARNLVRDPAEPLPLLFTRLPVIIYGEGGDVIAPADSASDINVQRIHAPDRLLDMVALFLHREVMALPEGQRRKISHLHESNQLLAGKKVLIVDDDARNIFALSSVLEEYEMAIESADNGRDAIDILRKTPDIDIVLMDIMMPEMDGMETIREVRKINALKNLPIIAVTAKAMKGDREKCIEAGAWDYLSKPVDIDEMVSVLKSWLHR